MLGINKSMRKITYYENILEFKENNNEELNLNEINNWKLCRTCLADTNENDVHIDNMSIMDVMHGTMLNIKQMLVDITSPEITITDNLPLLVCNDCFSKITELYYFCIQTRKAEDVLNRLINKFENQIRSCDDNNPQNEAPEDSLEDIPNIIDFSTEEPNRYQEVSTKSETTATSELIEETSENLVELFKDEEMEIVNDGEDMASLEDEESELLTEFENPVQDKYSSSDDDSHFESDLIEHLESCDVQNDSSSCHTIEEELKNTKVQLNKKRATSGITGYRHKQPRVTTPLLDDFDCAICLNSFGRQQDLVQHVRETHPNSKAYKCRVCENLFSHIQSLSRHMNTHKEAVVVNECKYCSKSFVRVDDLKRHIRVHTGERPYVCSICGKSFQQQSDLKCHQRRHDYEQKLVEPELFECTHCKKSYTSRTGLNWHKRKYHMEEENLHCCLICNKTFRRESELKDHSLTHMLPASYKCKECDNRFPSANDLLSHQEMDHLNESQGEKESERGNEEGFEMLDEEDRKPSIYTYMH